MELMRKSLLEWLSFPRRQGICLSLGVVDELHVCYGWWRARVHKRGSENCIMEAGESQGLEIETILVNMVKPRLY